MGVEEQRSFFSYSVEVGSFDQLMDRAFARLVTIRAGIPAPVVGKCEKDVGSLGVWHQRIIRRILRSSPGLGELEGEIETVYPKDEGPPGS